MGIIVVVGVQWGWGAVVRCVLVLSPAFGSLQMRAIVELMCERCGLAWAELSRLSKVHVE